MPNKPLLLPLLLLVLTGCHLGPDSHTPTAETPDGWKSPEAIVETPKVDFWWEVFEDPQLNCLEDYAIRNNPNLYVALERIIEARALAGINRAALFPQVNLNPSYSDTGFLAKFQGPSLAGNLPPGDTISPYFRIHDQNYTLPLDLSYQLDLWGTYRGQYNSAVYNAEAVTYGYHVALLTITTDLASAYFQMRSLDAQIDLLKATMNVRKNAYEVNQARWDAGLVNYTDVTRAALEFTNAEAQHYNALRLRGIQENQIAVLIGVPASFLELPSQALENPPPKLPANLPSAVLMKRPDIGQAERQMASNFALIGVAYAAFFPQITLTGTLGYLSPDLHQFLTWKSRLWALGADATQTVFDAGRNSSNLDATWAVFRETSGEYQDLVLTAFQEVEDSLLSLEWQEKQYESLQKSVESAKLTTKLSSERYMRGLVNYLDVVDSERAELEVEVTAIQVLGDRYVSSVQLIKAIGGGWDTSDDAFDTDCCGDE